MPYFINSNKIGRSIMKILGVLVLLLLVIGLVLYLIK